MGTWEVLSSSITKPAEKTVKPDISIIIPVLNEPGTIQSTLESLACQSTGKTVEIVVVDADPDESTLKAIDVQNLSGLLLKTAIYDKGRGIQMNKGADWPQGTSCCSCMQTPYCLGGASMRFFQCCRIHTGSEAHLTWVSVPAGGVTVSSKQLHPPDPGSPACLMGTRPSFFVRNIFI